MLSTPINTYLTPINTLHSSKIGQKDGRRIMPTIGKLLGHRDARTNLYFAYPRSRILTNEEYIDEFGEVMKI